MASYIRPTVEDVAIRAGITREALTMSEAEFRARLSELLPDGELETRMAVGTGMMGSTSLSEDMARGLQVSVCYRTGAAYLMEPAGRRATGTNAPLDQESSTEMREQIELLLSRASALEKALVGAFASPSESDGAMPSLTGFGSEPAPFFSIDPARAAW